MQVNEDFSTRGRLADLGRWHITRFVRDVARQLPPGTMILDAGAGECVYKKYFSHCEYRAVDLGVGESAWNYANLDYVAPLDDLPIPDATFDAILCTEVLEHLEKPRESVGEFFRVLKPGGMLYLTVPMSHDEHQVPYDFFRYTSYGLDSICRGAGFEKPTIAPIGGGMFVRWAYELPRMVKILPSSRVQDGRPPSLAGLAVIPLKAVLLACFRVMQVSFLFLDRFDKAKDDPMGWTLMARKPDGQADQAGSSAAIE